MISGRFLIRGSTASTSSSSTTGIIMDDNDANIDIDTDSSIISTDNSMDDTTTSSSSSSTSTSSGITKNHTHNDSTYQYHPIVMSDTSLSLWGGIDPITGIVIDQQHPLYNECVGDTIVCLPSICGSCTTSQVVLELILHSSPSVTTTTNATRKRTIPHTILLRDADAVVCIGAIIAQEFFTTGTLTPRTGTSTGTGSQNKSSSSSLNICNIICIGEANYEKLLKLYNHHHHHRSHHDETAAAVSLSQQQQQQQQQMLYGHVTSTGELHIRTKDGTILLPTTTTSNDDDNNVVGTDQIISTTKTSSIDDSNDELALSDEEQMYMNQATTDAERLAYKVIFRYSKLSSSSSPSNAMNNDNNTTTVKQQQHQQKRYIPIQQSHIDGCTYIGPGGIQFVQKLLQMDGKVKVPTTLNSVSTDRRYWQQYNVPTQYANHAILLGDLYVQLGCQPTFTCAPYLLLPNISSEQQQLTPDTLPTEPSQSMVTAGSNSGGAVSITKTTTSRGYTGRKSQRKSSILFGQDIAWGESNAVVYANSVLGARTEKYADYLDICCAITGIVPYIGVHVPNNRIPTIVIDGTTTFQMIQALMKNDSTGSTGNNSQDRGNGETATASIIDLDVLFPILGHLCGRLSDGRVPILIGFDTDISYWDRIISTDHLKSFCAAFGTTASSPLIHIAGITPEAQNPNTIQDFTSSCDSTRQRTITLYDLYKTYEKFNSATKIDNNGNEEESIDLIALGNPHLSISECADLASIIQQTNNPPTTTTTTRTADSTTSVSLTRAKSRIITCISREIYSQVDPNDIRIMSEFGIEFIYDTCWCMILDEPIIPHNPLGTIMTNSGKYAHYGPGLTKRQFRFGSMYDCIYAARYGYSPIRTTTTTTTTTIPSVLQQQQQFDATKDMKGISPKELHSTPSSSSSLPTDDTAMPPDAIACNSYRKNMDPYLSFLIRPLLSRSTIKQPSDPSHRINHPNRRLFSSSSFSSRKLLPHSRTESSSSSAAAAAAFLHNPKRTLVTMSSVKTNAAANRNAATVISSLIKRCCR